MASYRVNALKSWMEREGIDLVVVEDCEERRSASLRYLCGHPSDGLFFLHSSGASLLVAWDLPMAELLASADALVAYGDFQRSPVKAIAAVARRFGLQHGAKIDISPSVPLPLFEQIKKEAEEFTFLCRENGADGQLTDLRAIKDAEEVEIYHEAAEITNTIIEKLVEGFREERFETEIDAAPLYRSRVPQGGRRGNGLRIDRRQSGTELRHTRLPLLHETPP